MFAFLVPCVIKVLFLRKANRLSVWKSKETEAAMQKLLSSSLASMDGIEAMSIFQHKLVDVKGGTHNDWNSQLPTSRYMTYLGCQVVERTCMKLPRGICPPS